MSEGRTGTGLLSGLRVVERADGPAAAYAGRLLATMGAEVVMAEPEGGTPLRFEPPLLDAGRTIGSLFAYLACGKRSVVCPVDEPGGREELDALLDGADIFLDDTPAAERPALGLDPDTIARRHPGLVHVSVLPFGASGPKAGWRGHELNLVHASGEGFLLPNGLSAELFPDRPPLKIYGHFTEFQGGTAAALGALSALWACEAVGGQFVDVSVQDAGLAVGAFAVQRLGDGSLEHRRERSFKYGGVLECRDGFVELLTLEERQWLGLVELMGSPDWAQDPELGDGVARSRHGAAINGRIRAWALTETVADVVARAQTLGVPMARYNAPAEVLSDPHERARGLFQPVGIPHVGPRDVLVAPFHVLDAPPVLADGPPPLGERSRTVGASRGSARMAGGAR